jgi:DNA-binding CsgD family transcriptional regulator
MADENALKAALDAIDIAGVDEAGWERALAEIARLLNAEFATLETFDRRTRSHLAFRASSLPPGSMSAYLEHYAPLCPRTKYIWSRPGNDVVYDFMVMNDQEMDTHPYYQEFLNMEGLRYFMSGLVDRNQVDQTLITVQRSGRSGHVDTLDVQAMRTLLSRLGNSLDLTRRLRPMDTGLRGTLDWLRDGAAVLSGEEKIVYCNPAMEAILAAGDGVRLVSGSLELADANATAALARAIGAIQRQRSVPFAPLHNIDIMVCRPSGMRPYLLSARALPGVATDSLFIAADPAAIIFIRDIEPSQAPLSEVIRGQYGLTGAEARLAAALRQGIAPLDYADAQGLSHHTIYTHLRRLKEKLEVRSVGALVRLLADFDPTVKGG